jgi:hypothetical protein
MSIWAKMGLINETPAEETAKTNPSENTEKKEVKQENSQEIKKPSFSFAPSAAISTPGQIVGKIDNDIYDKLSVAIEENNLPGNDFLEFMQSLNKMSTLAVDEKSKFNMVFATLSTSAGGMTKDYLVSSISHYLSVIEKERNTFKTEMSKANTKMVTEKESYANQLLETAKSKTEQIQKLTEEIQQLNKESESAKSEALQSKNVIAQKEADFEVTVGQLEKQILDYKEKISQHIQ